MGRIASRQTTDAGNQPPRVRSGKINSVGTPSHRRIVDRPDGHLKRVGCGLTSQIGHCHLHRDVGAERIWTGPDGD